MRPAFWLTPLPALTAAAPFIPAQPPVVIAKPDAFETLVNPPCSHCRDEAARRPDLTPADRVLCWTRGYSDGGAIPIRFFLAGHRVISDSYGVFVYDPDAGFARGFAPSFDFRFHGWRNGVMVMRHTDGTLFSCLSGVAFDGPRKGARLATVPTLVSDWAFCMNNYPQAVAYQMFDKYRAVDLPAAENPDSARSRGIPDTRMRADERVFGVWAGAAKAYPLSELVRAGLIEDTLGGGPVVVLWEPTTKTAAAYRPVATQPKTYKTPAPDAHGVSAPDDGQPAPPGSPILPPRRVTIGLGPTPGRFRDAETKSVWDIAGRCIAGPLKGWTLECVDGVRVKWYAWAAEYPDSAIFGSRE